MQVWDYLVVFYWCLLGIVLVLILFKLLLLPFLFHVDDVSNNKSKVCESVIDFIERDLGVRISNLTIHFDYKPNDNLNGYYRQDEHSITLCLNNLDNVHSFLLTLIEEVHHAVFISSKSGVKIYELYHHKVGYDHNPLEYAAKVYAHNKFKSIHRNLKKSGLIRYKV